MTKWIKAKMGDICDLQQGLCINRKSKHLLIESTNGYPLLRIKDLIENKKEQYINHLLVQKQFVSDEKSLIYTRTGQVGLVFKNRKGVVHNNCFKIIPKPNVDINFLYYLLKLPGFYDKVIRLSSKSAQPDLTHSAFKSIDIFIPEDIQKQKETGLVISRYDNLIENNKKRIKILETMAQSLYEEWFVKFKFPGYEKIKMVDTHTEFGSIPEGWQIKKVKDSLEYIGGGTPSRANNVYWLNGDINWFTPTDLASNSMFMDSSSEKITNLGLKDSSAKIFPEFSVMMTSRATIGRISINTKQSTTNQGFIVCLPNDNIPLYFLYFWLKRNINLFIDLGTGATFKEITKGSFGEISILLPNKELSYEYAQKTNNIGFKILNTQRLISNLTRTRDQLISQLIK